MNEPYPVWGWLIKGLGGMINMMEHQANDDPRLTEHWLGELETLERRLREVRRSIDHRPENHL